MVDVGDEAFILKMQASGSMKKSKQPPPPPTTNNIKTQKIIL